MNTLIRKGNGPFYDDANFPRGFSRSGEFTITESNYLNDYGLTLKQLSEGKLQPENDEERRFVEVCIGEQEDQSPLEKTWKKYIKVTSPKKYANIYGSHKPEVDFDSGEYSLEL